MSTLCIHCHFLFFCTSTLHFHHKNIPLKQLGSSSVIKEWSILKTSSFGGVTLPVSRVSGSPCFHWDLCRIPRDMLLPSLKGICSLWSPRLTYWIFLVNNRVMQSLFKISAIMWYFFLSSFQQLIILGIEQLNIKWLSDDFSVGSLNRFAKELNLLTSCLSLSDHFRVRTLEAIVGLSPMIVHSLLPPSHAWHMCTHWRRNVNVNLKVT